MMWKKSLIMAVSLFAALLFIGASMTNAVAFSGMDLGESKSITPKTGPSGSDSEESKPVDPEPEVPSKGSSGQDSEEKQYVNPEPEVPSKGSSGQDSEECSLCAKTTTKSSSGSSGQDSEEKQYVNPENQPTSIDDDGGDKCDSCKESLQQAKETAKSHLRSSLQAIAENVEEHGLYVGLSGDLISALYRAVLVGLLSIQFRKPANLLSVIRVKVTNAMRIPISILGKIIAFGMSLLTSIFAWLASFCVDIGNQYNSQSSTSTAITTTTTISL